MIVNFDAMLSKQNEHDQKIFTLECEVTELRKQLASICMTDSVKVETADDGKSGYDNDEYKSFEKKVYDTRLAFKRTYGVWPKGLYISEEVSKRLNEILGADLTTFYDMDVRPLHSVAGYNIVITRY